MSSPIGFGLPPSAGQPALVFEPSVGKVPTNDPAGQGAALTAAQVQAVQALVGASQVPVFYSGNSAVVEIHQ